MSDYSELKRMIEDLVVERDGWKRSCEAANAHWASTRERDDFNRCEAHLRGRKISKLQQELRQAKDDLVEAGRIPEHAAVLSLQVERDQLKAENEALRKDAGRYRWLRESTQYDWDVSYGKLEIRISTPHDDSGDLDACIDAAMSKEP